MFMRLVLFDPKNIKLDTLWHYFFHSDLKLFIAVSYTSIPFCQDFCTVQQINATREKMVWNLYAFWKYTRAIFHFDYFGYNDFIQYYICKLHNGERHSQMDLRRISACPSERLV